MSAGELKARIEELLQIAYREKRRYAIDRLRGALSKLDSEVPVVLEQDLSKSQFSISEDDADFLAANLPDIKIANLSHRPRNFEEKTPDHTESTQSDRDSWSHTEKD